MRTALVAVAAALLLAAPLASAAAPDVSSVSGQAVVDQLMKLATYSDDANPAVTRILFTGAFEDLDGGRRKRVREGRGETPGGRDRYPRRPRTCGAGAGRRRGKGYRPKGPGEAGEAFGPLGRGGGGGEGWGEGGREGGEG